MATVDLRQYADEVRGKQGMIHGSKPKRFTTVYQIIHENGKKYNVRYPYKLGRNPRTVKQQAQRVKYYAAVAAWKSLNPYDKNVWKAVALHKNYTGYNAFIKNYLLTH